MKDCLDNQVQSALNIPYFEGDFWSNIIEESFEGEVETRETSGDPEINALVAGISRSLSKF